MDVKLSATGVLALAGLAVAGLLVYRVMSTGAQLVDAAGNIVTHELNPASSDNLVNQGLEAIGRSISGDDTWTFGGQLYDWTHTDQADPTKNTALAAINPASESNLINRGVSAIGRAVTGDTSWTLGGAIYDFFNPEPKG